ncbi:BadF/BadG/BcrA/BcrD ATPase family protein [Rhodovulum adriaticum]|uniref:Activator of 2-hydroxyglutaryl-CoA dehydratase n=1 Tax=Rhodovulum adriaticum TaxID=35804 RepID=A0A4R2NI83_RHOAD|nr:BadF/BadG/BcrA/BcrD ATPase family protein [Rhodovulum adriaticum]MBK1635411.1 CoA activase [Rhodovulum adriaticum]TCP21117.1 activator of 2-hydroxyglutaryl-CoA dehydratase [Rhodovulum adriaticum]
MMAQLVIGIDVGSTTVKTVLVDAATRAILWSRYQRHGAAQAATVLAQLEALQAAHPELRAGACRIFVTGSGARPLADPLGAAFIQEVNAVTLAVDALHPDAGSVIELGGQDAKIIRYVTDPATGERQSDATMNDRCASGTGAIIDKCAIKLGLDGAAAASVVWSGDRLHPVAAKCGVFAETDVVNLMKSGIDRAEIFCSLLDAIAVQNLSVLARGATLPETVILLGGPNLYLPALQACWRDRIARSWAQRGHVPPPGRGMDQLVIVPPNAHLYAAFGACLHGLSRPASEGCYRGMAPLRAHLEQVGERGLRRDAGPPLVRDAAELEAFRARYEIPAHRPPSLRPGETVRAWMGIDGGSTSSKAVLLGDDGAVLFKAYMLSLGNPIDDARALIADLHGQVARAGGRLDIRGVGTTGYAGGVLGDCLGADVTLVETVAHLNAARHYLPDTDVICDVGGQDIKVMFLSGGEIRDYRLSNQCSAGNGMLLQAMAGQFGIPLEAYADHAFRARVSPEFSYGCAVFLDADRVSFQKEGYAPDELLAGLARVLPRNIWQYIVQAPRLSQFGRTFLLQGGTQYNLAAVKAQLDYIAQRVPDAQVVVHPHPGEAGAIGAALEARQTVGAGLSRFVGLAAVAEMAVTLRSDEGTRCLLCDNRCKRNFIDVTLSGGGRRQVISGFGCERGRLETETAPDPVAARARKAAQRRNPNLAEREAKRSFRHMPGGAIEDAAFHAACRARPSGLVARAAALVAPARIARREAVLQAARARYRVGLPRVLNLYATAPLWRGFFQALGMAPGNVVFSGPTTPELWQDGAFYGANDPCFPAKLAQAHVHDLVTRLHARAPLDAVFFPAITHLPTFLDDVMDSAACPVVAGAPWVVKAAFTTETDFFARAGVAYLHPTVTLVERHYFHKQMQEAFGARLRAGRDEIAHACDAGFAALARAEAEIQAEGRALIERLEQEARMGILLLGRPYHADPGINHKILDAFQAHGFPILTIRALPRDRAWLARRFGDGPDLLGVRDVWRENYAANSAQKVWGAKFAARHPNLAVLDLSSFKCGQDAPTYGVVESIVNAAGTPYAAVHDIDANKPSGTIKIRIETFVHALRQHQARLAADQEASADAL